mgnify:FL=1
MQGELQVTVISKIWLPFTRSMEFIFSLHIMKVEPFSLVEAERDLLSLIRRYPKLFVAADFSKVRFYSKFDCLKTHPVMMKESYQIKY